MPTFRSLPGFRDFYPEDLAVREHVMSAWREVSRRYGFEEYDGPPLEPLELYVEKSGAEIVRQLYSFEDKGGREVALRPEMTPTLARMVGARARALRKPIRWFSIPQLFRYERTQRGRLREHFQWNVDLVGEEDVGADAEVLAVALDALRVLGLTAQDVVARISDRRLLERLLTHAGVAPGAMAAVYAIIDKLGREDVSRVRERLGAEAGLPPEVVERIFQIFDHRDLAALRRGYADAEGVAAELERLEAYFGRVTDMGLGEFVRFDPTIVRGLAYYTGIVFEIFDRRGELRALCGGGRYDDLLRAVSEVDLPAIGFGMGDVVLTELLRERGLIPAVLRPVDYFLVAVTEAERPMVLRLAHELRDAGRSVLYALAPASVGRQFREADVRGATRTVVIGPAEAAEGVAVVREMASGAERRVRLEDLVQ